MTLKEVREALARVLQSKYYDEIIHFTDMQDMFDEGVQYILFHSQDKVNKVLNGVFMLGNVEKYKFMIDYKEQVYCSFMARIN